jgi:hypothetical protein
MTFLAALRYDRIAAPCLFDGPIDGTSFLAWVQQFLLPTLRVGDVVIMDNLGSHKGIAVRSALRTVGAKLFFLPPYRSQSHRAGLRQAQDPAAQGRSQNCRSHRNQPPSQKLLAG